LDLNLIRDGVVEHNEQPISLSNCALSRTAIIGIGSPNEGDELGWQVIDQLQQQEKIIALKEKGLSVFKLDRPGLLLGECIKDYDHVLIVDAIKPGTGNKSFVYIDAGHISPDSVQLSSHEAGVLESIALMKSLCPLPGQLVIVGVADAGKEITEKIFNIILND
ncbi:hydrogenase maturation protease, partial [Pseudomonadota bacterium]